MIIGLGWRLMWWWCLVGQILRVAEIEKKDDVKRPYIRQLLEPGLKFPLPHRREYPDCHIPSSA